MSIAQEVDESRFDLGAGEEGQRIMELLGGELVCHRTFQSGLDAHEWLEQGLPNKALIHFIEHLAELKQSTSLRKVIGMSLRTIQRRKEGDPDETLSLEQGNRLWRFATILAKAIEVFGSQHEAERWLDQPAIGLNQRVPMELLATTAGFGIVENHLDRIMFGVYT